MSVISTCPICGADIDNDYPRSYVVIGAYCYCSPVCEEIKKKKDRDEWNAKCEANRLREKAESEAEQSRIEAEYKERVEANRNDFETLRQYAQVKAQQQRANMQLAADFEAQAKAHGFLSAQDALRAMEKYETNNFEILKQRQQEAQKRWEKDAKDRKIKYTDYCNSLGAAREPWKKLNKEIQGFKDKEDKRFFIACIPGIILPIILRIACKPLFEYLGWNLLFALILFTSFSFFVREIIEEYNKHRIIMKYGLILRDTMPPSTPVYLSCFSLGWEIANVIASFSVFFFFLLRHYLSLYLGFWKGLGISILFTAGLIAVCILTKVFGLQKKILTSEKALYGETSCEGIPREIYEK